MSSVTPPAVPELTGPSSQALRRRKRQRLWLWAMGAIATLALFVCLFRVFTGWNGDLAHWTAATRLQTLGCHIEWQGSKKEPAGGSTSVLLMAVDPKYPVKDADLEDLALLSRVRVVEFSRCDQITDDGLKWLEPLTELEDLTLGTFEKPMWNITDRGLTHVARMHNLKTLCLSGTSVTDEGIARLNTLKKLEMLDLTGTKITDEGLSLLAQLPNLRSLLLEQTGVTERAIRAVQRARPGIEIHSDFDHDTLDQTGAAPR